MEAAVLYGLAFVLFIIIKGAQSTITKHMNKAVDKFNKPKPKDKQ